MILHVLKGAQIDATYEVRLDCTIGRDRTNAVVLDDPDLSLVHCAFFFGEGRAFIKDLGSTNGTRVNGEKVAYREIVDSDVIGVGNHELRAEFLDESREQLQPGTVFTDEAASTFPDADGEDDAVVSVEEDRNIFGSTTYFLKRRIARGGMGAIYEAEQIGAEGFVKTVALKTILPEFARSDSFVASFIGEAKLVAGLVHQNIVQIYQLGRHGQGYYIAMEYIDGIDLTQFLFRHELLRRPIPIEIATYIVSRICRGLEYAHIKRGTNGTPLELVHRDVAPKNVMITNEGEVKLADFGVAKALLFMEEEDGAFLVGSPRYMSPEQAACEKVDCRSDIYSLGLVYYELLTGRPAYSSDDEVETIALVRDGDILIHPEMLRTDIPEEVVTMLMRCLSKNSSERYASASELGYALEYFMYSPGYGPTIVTLANYVAELFPDREFYAPPERPDTKIINPN